MNDKESQNQKQNIIDNAQDLQDQQLEVNNEEQYEERLDNKYEYQTNNIDQDMIEQIQQQEDLIFQNFESDQSFDGDYVNKTKDNPLLNELQNAVQQRGWNKKGTQEKRVKTQKKEYKEEITQINDLQMQLCKAIKQFQPIQEEIKTYE